MRKNKVLICEENNTFANFVNKEIGRKILCCDIPLTKDDIRNIYYIIHEEERYNSFKKSEVKMNEQNNFLLYGSCVIHFRFVQRFNKQDLFQK